MPPQTTVEPAAAGNPAPAAIAVAPLPAELQADGSMDLTQSAEVRASLDNLGNIASRANELARAAEDSAAENPEAAHDAQRAREAADLAVSGQAAILSAARRGDRGAVTRVISRSLTNAQAMVDNVSEELVAHNPGSSEGAKRIAREAETSDQKEHAQRNQASARASASRRARDAQRANRPPLVEDEPISARDRAAGRNSGNEGDELGQAAAASAAARAARGERPRTRADDDAPDAFRVRRAGESRGTAQRRTAVRRSTYDAARLVGVLDEQGASTAQRLETGVAHAQTEEERQYYERERGDAINRRLFGDTFIHQEFRDAARGLARLGYGGLSDTEITDRLIANGAMVEGYSNWGPFNASSNAQWSDRNVRRLDRNGDGQLNAEEIAYALRHGARAVQEMERYRAQQQQQAQQQQREQAQQRARIATARDRADTNDDGRISGEELNAAIRRAGKTFAQADTDHNGTISNAELANLNAPAAPRTPAARPRNH